MADFCVLSIQGDIWSMKPKSKREICVCYRDFFVRVQFGVCPGIHAYMKARGQPLCCSLSKVHVGFEDRVSHWPGAC